MYLDFLKGCLIFVVILGHAFQYSTYQDLNSFWTNEVFIAIYTFHMPLFIGVSGYLFTPPNSLSSFIKVLVNKIPRLMLPILSWAVLYILIVSLLNSSVFSFSKVFYTFIHSLWFIWVLIACILTLLVCNYFRYGFIFYCVFFLIAYEFVEYWFFNEYLYLLPFFVLGNIYKNLSLEFKIKLSNILVNRLSIILMSIYAFVAIQVWTPENFIYNSPVNFENVIPYLFRFFTAISNSILFIILTKLLMANLSGFFKTSLIEMGGKSLVLYALSSYIQPKIKPLYELNHSVVLEVIYTTTLSIIISACFLLIAQFVFKFNILKFFFIGKT